MVGSFSGVGVGSLGVRFVEDFRIWSLWMVFFSGGLGIMKKVFLGGLLVLGQALAFAGDVPRGFKALSELEEAKAEAVKKGKLIAIVAKGKDDSCPHCAAALEAGTRAIKSDCVMVFARAAEVRANEALPASVTAETADAGEGAWVTFYVFDAGLEKLVAEVSRGELQKDEEGAARAFKKQVDAARKELVGK